MPIAKPRVCSLGPSRAPERESVTTRRPSTRSVGVITFITHHPLPPRHKSDARLRRFFLAGLSVDAFHPRRSGSPAARGLGFGGGLPAPAEGVEVDIPLRVNQPRARRRFPLLEILLARGHCAPASASRLKTSPLRLSKCDGVARHGSAATRALHLQAQSRAWRSTALPQQNPRRSHFLFHVIGADRSEVYWTTDNLRQLRLPCPIAKRDVVAQCQIVILNWRHQDGRQINRCRCEKCPLRDYRRAKAPLSRLSVRPMRSAADVYRPEDQSLLRLQTQLDQPGRLANMLAAALVAQLRRGKRAPRVT